jgi:hypothetical protein
LALVVIGALGGCGGAGGDEVERPEADRTPTVTPSPTPTVPPQPEGEGATFRIRNWDEWYDDPYVLAYKRSSEVATAVANGADPLGRLDDYFTGEALEAVRSTLERGRADGWTLKTSVRVVVLDSSAEGDAHRVTVCEWSPDASFRRADGTYVVPSTGEPKWSSTRSTFVGREGQLRVEKLDSTYDAACKDVPPPT